MALRTSSIAPSQATPAAPADWRGRVDLAVSVAAARLAAADLDGLAAVFTDVAAWEDEHRAYQARCRLAELVLAYRPEDVAAWVRAFIAGAAHLLDALEREPREPSRPPSRSAPGSSTSPGTAPSPTPATPRSRRRAATG